MLFNPKINFGAFDDESERGSAFSEELVSIIHSGKKKNMFGWAGTKKKIIKVPKRALKNIGFFYNLLQDADPEDDSPIDLGIFFKNGEDLGWKFACLLALADDTHGIPTEQSIQAIMNRIEQEQEFFDILNFYKLVDTLNLQDPYDLSIREKLAKVILNKMDAMKPEKLAALSIDNILKMGAFDEKVGFNFDKDPAIKIPIKVKGCNSFFHSFFSNMVISPDSKMVAVKKESGFSVFSLKDGKEIPLFSLERSIHSLQFSPDSKLLYVSVFQPFGGFFLEQVVKISDGSIIVPFGVNSQSVVFSPDTKIMAVIDKDKKCHFLNTADGFPQAPSIDNIKSVIFSHDGAIVALIDHQKNLSLMQVSDWTPVGGFFPGLFLKNVENVVFSPNGTFMCIDNRIFKMSHKKEVNRLQDRANVLFSSDEKIMSNVSPGFFCSFYRLSHSLSIFNQEGEQAYGVNSVIFSPDNKIMALQFESDNECKFYSLKDFSSQIFPTIKNVYSVSFSPDGSMIAVVGKNFYLLNAQNGAVIKQINGSRIGNAVFSPDGQNFLLSTNKEVLIYKNTRYLSVLMFEKIEKAKKALRDEILTLSCLFKR